MLQLFTHGSLRGIIHRRQHGPNPSSEFWSYLHRMMDTVKNSFPLNISMDWLSCHVPSANLDWFCRCFTDYSAQIFRKSWQPLPHFFKDSAPKKDSLWTDVLENDRKWDFNRTNSIRTPLPTWTINTGNDFSPSTMDLLINYQWGDQSLGLLEQRKCLLFLRPEGRPKYSNWNLQTAPKQQQTRHARSNIR